LFSGGSGTMFSCLCNNNHAAAPTATSVRITVTGLIDERSFEECDSILISIGVLFFFAMKCNLLMYDS